MDTDFQIFRVLQLEEIISVFHSRGIVCASLALPAPRELEQMLRSKKATADLPYHAKGPWAVERPCPGFAMFSREAMSHQEKIQWKWVDPKP